jgi:hypothetical protein
MVIGNHASLHRIPLSAGKGILAVVVLVGVGRGSGAAGQEGIGWGRAKAVVTIPWGPGTARAMPVMPRYYRFVNIWRGRVTTNSVNSSTSLSTVIVPPCCFVTMS